MAQSESAAITGQITDPSKAVVSGARVSAINTETNVRYESRTNSAGMFVIPTLPPGNYEVEVDRAGFKSIVRPDVALRVQDRVELNFELAVGSSSETVTVTSGTPLLNTEDASVGTVVDQQFVKNMPLNGRSFQSLIDLTPGITTAKTYYTSSGQFSSDGQRPDTNYFSIDGASANVGINQGSASIGSSGAGALPAVSSSGGTNNLVSVDAVQEFKIQTSTFAPEFGRTPGAQVSIVTRSGSNQFHGTAFEYLRNDIFDAADWFTNYNHLTKPAERQNDFGGVFGGPIIKNRLFFFFSYEGLRLRLPQSKSEVVPSTTARDAAPADVQPILNAFPMPTGQDGPLTGVFSGSYSNPSVLDATSLRVDYSVNQKINIFGRYNHAPSNSSSRGAFNFYTLSTIAHTLSNVDTFTLGTNVAFTSRLVDEFRFNISRTTGQTGVTADGFGGAVVPSDSYLYQSYPRANSSSDSFVALLLPDVNGFFVGANGNVRRQRQLNFIDTLSWSLGQHSLKFGVDYRRLAPIQSFFPYQQVVSFDGVAGALTSTTSFALVEGSDSTTIRPLFENLSLFAQDTWSITSRLTMTYGVRWDHNPPPGETSGHPLYTVQNLNDPPNAVLAPKGTALWNSTFANFAPRVGVAYRVGGAASREIVFRGGVGLFYDLGNNSGAQGVATFPYGRTAFLPGPIYPLPPDEAAPAPFTLDPPYGTMQAFDSNLKLPRTIEWNFSVQQALGAKQSITATYLGSSGRKLLRDELVNYLVNLNPNFSGVTLTTNDGRSNYNALQFQYEQRISDGLQVLASYAWAHSLDNTPGLNLPSPYRTIYDPMLDYANSDYDVRNSFSAALSYEPPAPRNSKILRVIAGNWGFDSLFRASSALPVNVLTGNDPWGLTAVDFVDSYQRPDIVSGQPFYLYGSKYPGGKAFNLSAFANPASVSSQGDLGRNTLRGFGAWEEDFAIRRQFPIREHINLQFRAEFFNIFNHPNFGDPGTQATGTNMLTSPLFGVSTTTLAQSLDAGSGAGSFSPLYQIGGPRSIQFALKLTF